MTISKRMRPAKPGQIPDFRPVPRQTTRHDGWTEDRQRRFIEALAVTGSVKAAAHRVNMTPEGAYLLRRHPEAGEFRQAWEAALALGVQQLEDIALERALHGTEVPVYSYGKLVGSRIKHNDRLLMFMLKNRAPTRFAADGRVTARARSIGDPALANQLSALKKKWRKEWTAEQEAQARKRGEAAAQSINAKLEAMHQRHLAGMTTRTRALYEAYQAAEAEDKAAGRSAWTEAEWDEVVGADEGEDEGSSDARALPGPGVDGG
jgi:hypothetical protein